MLGFQTQRQVLVPAGYAERECVLVRYRFADPAGVAFLPAMFVGSVMVTLGYGPLFAALQDLAPTRVRSTLTAAMILGMTLLGTSAGNLLVGLLADRFRQAGVGDPITHAAAWAMMPWFLAIPCLHQAAKVVSRAGADEHLLQPVTP